MEAATAPPQHMTALQRGNEIRLARARELANVTTADLAALLREDPTPPWLETMLVYDLLLRAHRVGPEKARAYLRLAQIRETMYVGHPPVRNGRNEVDPRGMTERQRLRLADLLEQARFRPPTPHTPQ